MVWLMDLPEEMGSNSPGWIRRRRVLIGLILLELSFGSFRVGCSSVICKYSLTRYQDSIGEQKRFEIISSKMNERMRAMQ
jgi:hypothetical protein